MIAPGGTIGILGGGQLGRMVAIAARQLGYGVVVLDPSPEAPAVGVADRFIRASFEDTDAARLLAQACDVVTYEFENVSVATAQAVEQRVAVYPDAWLLGVTQDRVREHAFVHGQGIGTAPGIAVRTREEIEAGALALGFPCRLKAAHGGYDGGGQWRIQAPSDLGALAAPVDGRSFLLEAEVRFDREVSVIVARSAAGETRTFPVFENVHRHGILHKTTCPAELSDRARARAEEVARALAEAAGLVGTLTVEMFVVGDDVLVNELAPRVHNSGHLTIEACDVSQFEQHVRAVCGLPLRAPALRAPACMINLLGTDDRKRVRLAGVEHALALPEVHVHVYGKVHARPRRKMGHVTALGPTLAEAVARAEEAAAPLSFR